MNRQTFGKMNADFYDLLYSDKDYEAECDLLEKIFRRYGIGLESTLLDLGCGTGGHALPLAQRGYRVMGVDRSQAMLERARQRMESMHWVGHGTPPTFLVGDLRSIRINRRFDAVLMMFAVLGYQLTNDDVQSALLTVRHHLRPGGLFVADFWYGPAVLAMRPQKRLKKMATGDGEIIRDASASLDILNHLAEVRYSFAYLNSSRVLRKAKETHQVRFFFPQELSLFLKQAKLDLMGLRAFGNLEITPGEDTWNAMIIAKSPQ